LDLSRRPVGVDDFDAPRVAPRNGEVPGSDQRLEVETLFLEDSNPLISAGGASPDSRERCPRVNVKQNRQVRLSAAADDSVERLNGPDSQLPPVALVSSARVIEPVADHNLASGQRRADDLIEVLGARGVHQREFGQRMTFRGAATALAAGGQEEEAADLLAHRRAAWLASSANSIPQRPQVVNEKALVSALARPINPFERDE